MKDYFAFNLKPQRFLAVWILFLVLFMVPYVYFVLNMKNIIQPQHPSTILEFYGILLLIIIICYAMIFYMLKLTIEGIEFKGNSFVFEGTFGQFIGKFLLGLFLSIITLGIYLPWFITNMQKFYIDNTSHDSHELEFAGTAGKLFKIMFFATFLPLMTMMIILMSILFKTGSYNPKTLGYYTNLATFVILIPYLYYLYKWLVNVNFRDYTIRWETNFWNSFGKILLEVFLSIITVGIYYPYARLRLYKYFVERTIATSENSKKGFGYELEAKEDFLYIWSQIILSIITLGIYYPWAYCNITARILGKTYSEQLVEESN
jgi:uncharacterized membrane protein YjgN (DUF898 family)